MFSIIPVKCKTQITSLSSSNTLQRVFLILIHSGVVNMASADNVIKKQVSYIWSFSSSFIPVDSKRCVRIQLSPTLGAAAMVSVERTFLRNEFARSIFNRILYLVFRLQRSVYSCSFPSTYLPGLVLLNFADQSRIGVLA